MTLSVCQINSSLSSLQISSYIKRVHHSHKKTYYNWKVSNVFLQWTHSFLLIPQKDSNLKRVPLLTSFTTVGTCLNTCLTLLAWKSVPNPTHILTDTDCESFSCHKTGYANTYNPRLTQHYTYVPEGLASVEFRASRNWAYIWSTMYVHAR
jgi:hypothetical protein